MYKFDGKNNIVIPIPLTRQIAGRAGRYRSASDDTKKQATPAPPPSQWPSVSGATSQPSPEPRTTTGPPIDSKTGFVTTFVARDLDLLKSNMATDPPEIEQAVILPRNTVLENYCALFPSDTPFHGILERIASQAHVSDLFTFSNIGPMIEVAKLLAPVEGLSDIEKINLSLAPVKLNIQSCVNAFVEFAKRIAMGKQSTLLDFPKDIIDIEALEIVEEKAALGIKRLEELHTVIMLYAWVAQRFRHTLTGDDITRELKTMVEEKIDLGMRTEEKNDVVLRRNFREDPKRGKTVRMDMPTKAMDTRQHPAISQLRRLRPSDRARAEAA
ncbi:hypothetical protein ABW19_dt0200549 [Dactylella cylindrospora]|nr:hypothetical protein ABW19_dt0200549 [Dactylella cylindrospora]